MSKKQESILQILKIMQENEITLADIKKTITKKTKSAKKVSPKVKNFDLLCNINGSYKRLPFETGKDLNPIGIFPFADQKDYIVFNGLGHFANGNTKMHYSQTHRIAQAQIPSVDFFEEIFKIRQDLNEALTALNKPEFKGPYLAVSPDYIPEANWIVAFFEGTDSLACDFYESKEEAKVCYIKKFYTRKIF